MAPLQFLSRWGLILTAAGKDSGRCGVRESCSLSHQNTRSSGESKMNICSFGGRINKRSIRDQKSYNKKENRGEPEQQGAGWAFLQWNAHCLSWAAGELLIIVHVTVMKFWQHAWKPTFSAPAHSSDMQIPSPMPSLKNQKLWGWDPALCNSTGLQASVTHY